MKETFLALFPCRNDSVVRSTGSPTWRQVSRFHYLTDDEILESIELKTKLRRGFQFDDKTKILITKIPAASPYFTEAFLVEFREALKSASIDSKAYRIDEDWYLYIFLSDWMDSDEALNSIERWCQNHGFHLDPGILEVHPSGQALPFPLQPGFSWLNDFGHVIVRREEIAAETALALFHADIEKHAVSPQSLQMLADLLTLSRQSRHEELIATTEPLQCFSGEHPCSKSAVDSCLIPSSLQGPIVPVDEGEHTTDPGGKLSMLPPSEPLVEPDCEELAKAALGTKPVEMGHSAKTPCSTTDTDVEASQLTLFGSSVGSEQKHPKSARPSRVRAGRSPPGYT